MKKTINTLSKAAMIAATALVALPTSLQAAEIEGWGDFKLYIDPGHAGRENQGLWGYSEAEKTLRVALNVRAFLQQYTDMPEECIKLCRETDSDQISLEERSDEANAWGADFYYSIHSDASATKNTIVTLFGGWTVDGVNVEKTPNGGKAYGEFLNPNLAGVMRVGTRGNRYDRDFYMPTTGTHENQYPYLSVNRRSNMPSLLSEGGYHTLAEQQQRNMNDDYKRLEAFAAFQSILQYRGLNRPSQTFLTGMVYNSENNQPINGAVITVGDKTYTTDTYESLFNKYTKNPNLIHNGFYLFEGLEAGQEVEVTFEAEGFEKSTQKVTIKGGGETSADYVTFLDVPLTNVSPAKVDAISLTDLEKVSSFNPLIITFSRNMDRASVEEAFSINNDGKVALSWENDYTLVVDLSQLDALWEYTITIDGNIAKNSQTGQTLDGDSDGQPGGDYVLTFTMAEPDVDAPEIVSTYPAMDGEAIYTQRPPIRIEFNEILDWNDDKYEGWFEVSDSKGKTYNVGHIQHSVIREASVLHCYLSEDLDSDVAVLVSLKPVKDLSGNETKTLQFRFLSEYRPCLETTLVRQLSDLGEFWAPDGSGSSKGLTQEMNSISVEGYSPFHGQNTCFTINYDFDPDSPDGRWLIRDHDKTGSDVTFRGREGILTMWVYGDGSNNTTGIFVRDDSSQALLMKADELVLDYRGWKLWTWDIVNDEWAETQTAKNPEPFKRKWYLDAIYVSHDIGEDPVLDPEEEGYMYWAGNISYYELASSKWDETAVRTAKIEDIELGSGVESVAVGNGIAISSKGAEIFVSANENLTEVAVYSIDGRMVSAVNPAAAAASVSLDTLPAGVYVVKASTESQSKTVKVVR